MIGGPTWRALLIVLSASGCDLLFQLDHIASRDGGSTDASIDARQDAPSRIDDAPPACAFAQVHDMFSQSPPCDQWGMAFEVGGATATISNGQLNIVPAAAATDSVAGCKTLANRTFGPGGVAIRVNSVVYGQNTYTFLQLFNTTTPLQIGVTGDGTLRFQSGPGMDIGLTVAFSATDTPWWRIRPIPPNVVGEYSSDGVSWTTLGVIDAVLTTTGVEINAGARLSNVSGVSAYDDLVICP